MERRHTHKNSRGTLSQNQSVLIQFLLREFIDSFRHVQDINLILKKKQINTSSLKAIGELLARIIGPLREENEFFTWMERSGAIRLFGHYCHLVCEYEKKIHKDSLELLRVTTLAMHDYILGQEILKQGTKSLTSADQQLTQFLRYLERAGSSFTRASEIIPDIIYRFRKDENILFFLLRHGEEIDSLFNQGFIKDLLVRCHPKGGIEKAESYMISRYEARGFSELPIQISHFIEQLS